MKIKQIVSQYRRDFYAIFECEHCGDVTKKQSGYDDEYFHSTVIPNMKCVKCDKKADDSYRPLSTKYDSGTVV